jgi:hypothetical protein
MSKLSMLDSIFFFRIRKSVAYHCIKKGKSSKYKEATGQRKEKKKQKQPKEETPEQTKDPATLAWTLLSRHQQLQILCPCPHPHAGLY